MNVVFEHGFFIILKLRKTKLEKRSLCALYLVTALRYFLEEIFKQKTKELKLILRTNI